MLTAPVTTLATLVETEELWQTAVAAVVAGVGVTVVFALGIYGATRFVDLSRDERPLGAAAAALLMVCALLATLGAVAIGLVEMAQR
jgi:cytochrome c biogenesis protein CcdA